MEHNKMQVDLSMIAPEEFSTVLCIVLQEQEAIIGRLSDAWRSELWLSS